MLFGYCIFYESQDWKYNNPGILKGSSFERRLNYESWDMEIPW